MFLMAQLWLFLLFACVLGILIGLSSRRLHRAVQLQHTLEAVEFRHTEQMAGISAEHEAALASLEQLRHDLAHSLEHGGRAGTGDLQTRIDLREQQLKELGNQLRRVNQELIRTEAARQQVALERRQAGDEIETLRAQVVSSRARLAQVVSAHEQEKSALVRQLVALMPAAGVPGAAKPVNVALPIGVPTGVLTGAAAPAAGVVAAPLGTGTFSAAASMVAVVATAPVLGRKRASADEAGGPAGGSSSGAAPGAATATASMAVAPSAAAPVAAPGSAVDAPAAPSTNAAGGDAGMQAAVQAGIAAALAAVGPARV
jgi:hypothetical protein